MTYRYVLQSVPSAALPPQSLRPVFQHAMQVVATNDIELEKFIEGRMHGLRARYADEPLQRFDRCLQILLRKQPVYRPQPSFMYFPRLPAIEFYERGDFPWLDSIEAATSQDPVPAPCSPFSMPRPVSLRTLVSRIRGLWCICL